MGSDGRERAHINGVVNVGLINWWQYSKVLEEEKEAKSIWKVVLETDRIAIAKVLGLEH